MYQLSKKLLNSNISTCSHNVVNFSPLTAEIGWRVWGTLANFNRFRVLASLLHRHRSTEVNESLHDIWPSPGLVHYIHFWGRMTPSGILPGAKSTLHPSLDCPILAVLLKSTFSGHQPNFAMWYKEWNYGTFTDSATYMAGRPSCWALVHISSFCCFSFTCKGWITVYQFTRI